MLALLILTPEVYFSLIKFLGLFLFSEMIILNLPHNVHFLHSLGQSGAVSKSNE